MHLPDPVVSPEGMLQPEEEALLANSVGLALLVVLDTLSPADGWRSCCTTCSLPFEEIAPMVGRSPGGGAAAHQQGQAPRQGGRGAGARPRPRSAGVVVDAFFSAARRGHFDALVALLDPDVVLRADAGARAPATQR